MVTYLHNRHATNLASFGRVLYNSEHDGRMIAAGVRGVKSMIGYYGWVGRIGRVVRNNVEGTLLDTV